EVDTDKRNVLHDDLPERKTPCQHTAHRVGVTISLNPGENQGFEKVPVLSRPSCYGVSVHRTLQRYTA
ncbi:hypothetical protein ACQVF6_003334, partial [Yersinia enterocolitica]